ncbi:tripartite tricarboxylate transporter substrate binding protein [Delftia tsuruhatensis]|uniref:Bug family tripartite tricarboxylate transporter substrate binding protein n=1 Tax=Delftia tsuruhatensis TaxID=180282 RepID=UPI002444CB4A|nr:tripartite tricarboxylate transporter substrate binding protein [Delftia tsuruhatensis]MDH0772725.1 tripartite tricarboxylate transporter substrate binding protein [Delftia tsuruhatensis]MDH1456798.1 tripartite tricarboxylate transporter substrate binding protein [Delftia tsuruhatensis]MDH1821591.1 tripartite tricarboxylate transporter substrate binding protein [Delftia tsuruhatensis]WGG08902.1 tripartite tricarboxylate transporter substrate binding protein [Delftia tsuruhatensis]
MALSRSRFLSCLMAGAATLALPFAHAQAQSYPDRPIKLVVPFAPGGATDILGRLLATSLGERLGQPVVVENRPGAGTVVAGALVAKAPPDGYTLLLGASTTLTLNPVIRNPLPYDPLRSFTPLGLVADMGLVLVAHNETPARTLPELVALAKTDPDKLSYGSFGTGSSVHFGGEMLKTATGMRMVHVPFNGSSPSLTALMGGQVQVAVDTVVATTPLIKAGKIRPIAALGPQRLPLLPQVPTVAESGYPGFAMDTWFAFLAPAGLPAPIQKKLEKALADTMAEPAMKKKLVDIGLSPAWGPGSALQERIERELPQMRAVAARADIKVD